MCFLFVFVSEGQDVKWLRLQSLVLADLLIHMDVTKWIYSKK